MSLSPAKDIPAKYMKKKIDGVLYCRLLNDHASSITIHRVPYQRLLLSIRLIITAQSSLPPRSREDSFYIQLSRCCPSP